MPTERELFLNGKVEALSRSHKFYIKNGIATEGFRTDDIDILGDEKYEDLI
jgi:hypothetical protein